MESILVTPKTEKQLNLLKSLFEEMKIKFKPEVQDKSPYSAEFVEKVLKAAASKKRYRINPDKLWENIENI